MAMKNEGLKGNILKSMMLETFEKIYSNLRIDQMRVINIGGGDNQKDVVGSMIAKVMTSFQEISKGLEEKKDNNNFY